MEWEVILNLKNKKLEHQRRRKIVKDPLTNEARRIDFAVVKNGKVKELVEVTSKTSNKALQTAKENRIRNAGGTYIRDKTSKKLIDVSNIKTKISRRE